MMKAASFFNNPWLVMTSCVAGLWWLMENKAKFPDEIEPATVYEVSEATKHTAYNARVAAATQLKAFWVSKCRGIASSGIGELMRPHYETYKEAANGVDHNWRFADPDDVYELLRGNKEC